MRNTKTLPPIARPPQQGGKKAGAGNGKDDAVADMAGRSEQIQVGNQNIMNGEKDHERSIRNG